MPTISRTGNVSRHFGTGLDDPAQNIDNKKNKGNGNNDNDDKDDKNGPDADCNDFWSDIPILKDILPEDWREGACKTGKSITKGYNDCAGLGIPCGILVVGGLAVVLLLVTIKSFS